MQSKVAMEDRLEILELCARYQQLFDDGMDDAWADTFSPDGHFEGPAGVADGRDELAAFCRRTIGQFPVALHFTDHHVLDPLPGGSVRHRCILSVQYPTKDGVQIALYRYDDELERVDGQWKFKSRRVTDP